MSQESKTGGLGDGGGPRRATQLAADVRDVAVHGMRTQEQLLCDLAIAETARHAGEDLALAT
jgi:predicted solute-binding protein